MELNNTLIICIIIFICAVAFTIYFYIRERNEEKRRKLYNKKLEESRQKNTLDNKKAEESQTIIQLGNNSVIIKNEGLKKTYIKSNGAYGNYFYWEDYDNKLWFFYRQLYSTKLYYHYTSLYDIKLTHPKIFIESTEYIENVVNVCSFSVRGKGIIDEQLVSPKSGVFINEVEDSEFYGSKALLDYSQAVFYIDYSQEAINEYLEEKEKENRECLEYIDRVEIEKAKQKLLEKERKKELEKKALRELIDEGLIDDPNDEELKELRRIAKKRNLEL